MAFTPDGQKVVSIDIDGKMILWDTFTRKTLLKTDVIAGAPYSPVVFTAGADLAAILSPDLKKVGILDVTSIQPVQKMGDGDLSYSSIAISNLGTYTAAVDELNHIHIWDSVSGQEIRLIEPVTRAPIWKIKFSPDEKIITSLSTGQVLSWEIGTGRKLSDLAGLTDFVYSPDSALIASDGLNAFYLSEVQSGKMKMALTSDTVTAVQYSPNGRIILAGAQNIAKIDKREEIFIFQVDTVTKKILDLKLTNVPALVTNMAFSPNGDILANSDLHGNIMFWNLRDGKPLILFQEIACPPVNLKFSADGRYLYVGSGDDSISVLNTSPVAATAPEPSPTAPSAAATPTKKASASTYVEAPALSKTPYTHSKGLITVTLPESWKIEEKEGAINVIDPKTKGGIAFSAVNTVSILKGDMFTSFVEANEVSLKNSIAEYQETKKELDPENGKAVVIKNVILDGEDYVWETRYSREQAAVYMFNFLTPAASAAVMAPLNDKVAASAKVSYSYVSKLIPFLVTSGNSDPAGNYFFESPMGWMMKVESNNDAEQPMTTTMFKSPDNKVSIVSIRVEGDIVWDEAMVKSVFETLPNSLADDTIIKQRENTTASDPQIDFSSVSKKTKGTGVSSNFGSEIHVFYVLYQTDSEKAYLPLVNYLLKSYIRKK
ncbi:MAG: WD40 repeat domain-containing protein [Anaerolineaceae bacterium]